MGFILFLVNQISGIYLLIRDFSPVLAKATLLVLVIMCSALVLSPLFVVLKLPSPIPKPKSASDLPDYHRALARRLHTNKYLKAKGIGVTSSNLQEAITPLDEEALRVIKATATTVFLTTSVSQNGKLDALTVFSTQMRMVWKIAHVYYQRPTIKELTRLYSFVAINAFVASEIEELDISQQIEPVAGAIFKNASGKAIPLIGPSATIIMDSLLEGSTNAFLTLRVGLIAKKYCGHLDVWDSKEIKRSAYRESASLLKSVAMSASGKIVKGILSATKKAGIDSLKNSWRDLQHTTGKVGKGIVTSTQKLNPFPGKKEKGT